MTSPKRNALIRPRPLSPACGGNLERDFGDVENDAIRVGKGEDVQVDLAVDIHDEPRLRLVAAEPDVGRHRK